MRRREFITLLGGAIALPLSVRAQEPAKLPIIGLLGSSTALIESQRVAAFVQRLHQLGWIENRNVVIEYRWAEGRQERFAEIAAEFVQLKVDLIVAPTTPAVMAAKQATSLIPIVIATADDPVGTGLVASLARPGGNVTGLSNQQTDLAGNRLELLREVVPTLRRVGLIGNVNVPNAMLEMKQVQALGPKLGLEVATVEVRKTEEIMPGLEGLRGRVDALYICTDPLLTTHRGRITTFALSEKLPTMYAFREYVLAGGLMSYGPNFPDLFRRAADHVDRILRGTKPAEIPIEQPVKFDLIVNLKTARALGL